MQFLPVLVNQTTSQKQEILGQVEKRFHSQSTSSFNDSLVSCWDILGTTSALVTPPTASMSAKASQLGVGIPPPVPRPCEPVSDKILAK